MKNLPVFNLQGLMEIKQSDVLVSRFAPYLKAQHQLLVPHGHSFYHIVFFTKGKGKHIIDFDQFEVKPLQIYFMIPGQVHNWEFDGAVDGFVLNFSNHFFQSFLLKPDYLENFSFLRGNVRKSVVDVPEILEASITSLFEKMLQIDIDIKNKSYDRLRVLILQLFYNVSDICNTDSDDRYSSYNMVLLRNFQKLVESNFLTLKLPKEYAELLFVTPNHLNALCNQMMGLSAGELIRNRIVLEAKRLLINLKLSISEIAYQLNFNDNSYFTKFFKKQEGCTPEEFRNKSQKINSKILENEN